MNVLSWLCATITHSIPSRARVTWRRGVGALCACLLTACGGGGGGGGGDLASAALAPQAAQLVGVRSSAHSDPALVAQPISVVNTTTLGDQILKTVGALNDGGYAVAWLSGATLYVQRYDSAGSKSGTETALQLVLDSRDIAFSVLASSSVAVLSDGSVVVAYSAIRSSTEPNSPVVTEYGVYIQRFDANGIQIMPETRLVSHSGGDPRRPTLYQSLQVLALPDGGYVVGWVMSSASATVGSRDSFYAQRFSGQNERSGGVVNIGAGTIMAKDRRIVADANGGYTVYWSGSGEDFLPTGLMVTHYDANQSPTQILTAWPGAALLLPLEDGRYVLYTSDAGGAYRQFLDSAGVPVGERTVVASMPASAQVLADRSFVVFWTAEGGATGQRFDPNGQPIGDVLTVQMSGTQPVVAALVEGGFAMAWSAPGASADLDVYTQSFLEVAGNQRKACVTGAKGLRGQERKAFMMACLR